MGALEQGTVQRQFSGRVAVETNEMLFQKVLPVKAPVAYPAVVRPVFQMSPLVVPTVAN